MNVSGVSVKEVVEIVESRVPGGRYVIPILLCLLILTVATACGAYLYHALMLPVAALITTGQIAPTTIGGMIGSIIGSIILYLGGRYMQKSILANYDKILANDEKHARDLDELIELKKTNLTIHRVSTLEKQGRVRSVK
jgi:membrane protein DedA with SNARE-associated domain